MLVACSVQTRVQLYSTQQRTVDTYQRQLRAVTDSCTLSKSPY